MSCRLHTKEKTREKRENRTHKRKDQDLFFVVDVDKKSEKSSSQLFVHPPPPSSSLSSH